MGKCPLSMERRNCRWGNCQWGNCQWGNCHWENYQWGNDVVSKKLLPGVQVNGGQVLGSSEPSPQSSWPSHFHQNGMHFRVELHLEKEEKNIFNTVIWGQHYQVEKLL